MSVFSFYADDTLFSVLREIIVFKKYNSFFKKQPSYFNFFKTIKPLANSHFLYGEGQSLLPLFDKCATNTSLYNKRPFDRRKLKKKLLALRFNYKKFILNQQSTHVLTKQINRFKLKLTLTLYIKHLYNILSVLKRLIFCQTFEDARWLLANNLVFVNKQSNTSCKYTLASLDLLELVIMDYYIHYILYYNKTIKKNIYRHFLKIKYKARTLEKSVILKAAQKTVKLNFSWWVDYSNSFEICNYTFSAMLIKNNYFNASSNISFSSLYSWYIMRLYN